MNRISIFSYDEYEEYKILKKENKRLKGRHAIRHPECLWCLSEPGGATIHAAAEEMCARCNRIPRQKDSEFCPTCHAMEEEITEERERLMTKTQKILEYYGAHPNASQRDITSDLGFSRQLVSVVLKRSGIKAAPVEYEVDKPGPPCKYCGKEITSWVWDKKASKKVRCLYHQKCAWEALRYRGECPVCGTYFERIGSQVKRSLRGRPTSGVVCCSDLCKFEAKRRGLYDKGRPKQGARSS